METNVNKYMQKDTQSQKWQITINDPLEKNLSHEKIKELISTLKSVKYWCMANEIGLEGQKFHTHLFLYCSRIRFSTIKNLFPQAHIEQAYGTAAENRDYVAKCGRWAEDDKAATSVAGSFEEWGELPDELGPGFRSDIADIYQKISLGLTNAEIMALNPDAANHIGKMDKIRQDILEARYQDTFREMEVTYIFGPTATGKTRSVYEEHGYTNVYRVTDYKNPFDRYKQEPVLCLDEFRSSLSIGDMLNYLDGYPISLPARYAPRVACYSTVYIISNIDLKRQYLSTQAENVETWHALLRRIHRVVEYVKDSPPVEHGSALKYIYPLGAW